MELIRATEQELDELLAFYQHVADNMGKSGLQQWRWGVYPSEEIIREDVRDPRSAGTYSIVRAEATRDLRYCKVRVSILESELRAPMMEALKKAAGFIRRELSHRMMLRYTPELLFELDTNIEYAAHINEILKQTEAPHEDGNT